jgi:mono/diheme cytochrome c family protein
MRDNPSGCDVSRNRSLAVLAALGLIATSTPAAAQTVEGAAPVDPGKAAYVRGQCDFCHGPNGNGAMGPGLVPFAKGPGYLLLVVRQGLGLMPSHPPDIVSDDDVRAIYRFLRVDPSAAPAKPVVPKPKATPRPRRR